MLAIVTISNYPMIRRAAVIKLILCLLLINSGALAQRSPRTTSPFPQDTTMAGAHAGVLIVEEKTSRAIIDYQSRKYFVPASNMKILSTYLAMKVLGDSIIGLKYLDVDTAFFIRGTGDPGFLHPFFQQQPVYDFLKRQSKPIYIDTSNWRSEPYGSGWSWDDYSESYLPERSALPIYGNTIRWVQERTGPENPDETDFDQSVFIYSIPEVEWDVRFNPAPDAIKFKVKRALHENAFLITQGSEQLKEEQIPFITNGVISALQLLKDTLGKQVYISSSIPGGSWDSIASRPLDSLLKPMMKESDNLFAEQLLMMVSEKKTGILNDEQVRDSSLVNEFSFIKNKIRWADGSGLSRYNLVTPSDFVDVLSKMKEDFGLHRIKRIFTKYEVSNGVVYAKTGTMSGVVTFSGFLEKKNGRLFTFSILINNHRSTASAVRKRIMHLLEGL